MATRAAARSTRGTIRTGIGGWVYPPWRETFYPPELKPADALAYAASKLGAIEINATFYRTQTAATFARWRDATPDAFVFAVKAARGAAQRTDPAEAAPAIARFLQSGLSELGSRLGPILWQLPPGRRFDPGIVQHFLDLLPQTLDGHPLRHVIEAQHPSFAAPEALALLAERGVARAILDTEKAAPVAAVTADLVYLRLQRTEDAEPAGYAPAALDQWAEHLAVFAAGTVPPGMDVPAGAAAPPVRPRDVFAFVISGAKHRAPAAAMALAERIPSPLRTKRADI